MILGATSLCAGPIVGERIYALAHTGATQHLSYNVPLAEATAFTSHGLSGRRKMFVGAAQRSVHVVSVSGSFLTQQSIYQLEV